MEKSNLLDKNISYQPTVWGAFEKEITINEALEIIIGDRLSKQIKQLRVLYEQGKKDEYDLHKKNLPAVTFCGTFDNKRRRESLKDYSQLIVLDIDKLEYDEIERVKSFLISDEYVFSFWDSPSKHGVKGLVHVCYEFGVDKSNIDKIHALAFNKLESYFSNKYNIDIDQVEKIRQDFASYPMIHSLFLKNLLSHSY